MFRRLGRYLRILTTTCLLLAFYNDYSHGDENLGAVQQALLLTAHPDDECMFFAPTILHLVQNSVALYSLCLSNGDAEGLGNIREGELTQSLRVLGIPRERSWVVNNPLLQDNFTQPWSPEAVAEIVKSFVVANNISLILTFDGGGVSQHPNHISLPDGASHLLGSPLAPPARLFTLKTISLSRKYIGPTSNPLTKLNLMLPWASRDTLTYIAGVRTYLTALRAMYQHQSQLVWYRWLYVLFSQYMWVNEWAEVKIHAAGSGSGVS